MSKYKHTPAPWRHDTSFHLYRPDDYSMVKGGIGHFDPRHKESGFSITGCMSDADAKLIAAAPELLEALKMVVRECNLDEWPDVEGYINSAIKKATL